MTINTATLQRARTSGNPVIHGGQATFIWEGKTAPTLAGDFNDWDSSATPFKRLSPRLMPASAKSIWSCTLTLPRDAYVEYAFDDPLTKKRSLDPLNRDSVNNGVGGRNNFFYMPNAKPTPLTPRRADVPAGEITTHRVNAWMLQMHGERAVHLYHPPVKERVPLLIVYDGGDYLQRGKLAVVVDNLIAQKRIRPLAMALLQNGGRRRAVEYACSDAVIAWLDHEILPLARRELNLLDIKRHPGAYGVLGASFGGLMSVYTGLRMPEIFGNVLSQSGVFGFEGRDFAAVDLIRHRQAREIKIWMDAGKLEWLLKDNRRMQPLLKEKGYNVTYCEYTGGHNFTAWRNDIWRGLEAMFPK
jgi:enterochelin esterase family protein